MIFFFECRDKSFLYPPPAVNKEETHEDRYHQVDADAIPEAPEDDPALNPRA
jgi:hypothetical protein